MDETGGRAGSAIAGLTEIGDALDCAGRGEAFAKVAGSGFEFGCAGWNIEDQPMPETAAGGGILIIHRDGKALGTCWGILPG